MKTKLSPTIVGAFVLGFFALGLGALLSFGSLTLFQKPLRFEVYFHETIQGLNLGSPVKLRGVSVGRVIDLRVRYDESTNRSAVAVLCEFDRNMISNDKGQEIDVTDRAKLQSLIDHGLRANLGVIGLATGLLYVELELLDPAVYPADVREKDLKYPIVPSVPSVLSEFQTSATEILARLRRIDFEGIGTELKALLVDSRRQLDSLDLHGLVEQWKQSGQSVNALANSPEIKQTFAAMDQTLASVRTTLDHLNQQIDTNGKDLQTTLMNAQSTLKEFNTTALTLHRFIAAQQGLGESATKTFTQLAEAADAVQRLADYLERNPNALISGKKLP